MVSVNERGVKLRFSNFASVLAVTAATYCVGVASMNQAWAAPSPLGVWYDHTRSGAIEIRKCGKALCGYIVWTKNPRDAKKGCGKPLIRNVKYVGRNTWDRGLIYSPTDGKDYSVELKPISNTKLKVLGYAGSKFFSKTMYWKRAPKNLKRCDKKTQTQVAARHSRGLSAATKPVQVAVLRDAPPPVRRPATLPHGYTSQPMNTAATAAILPDLVAPKPVLARRPSPVGANMIAREGRVASVSGERPSGVGAMVADGAAAKQGDGFCTIRVPFATISIPCEDR